MMLWGKGRYAKPGYTTGATEVLERGFFYLLVRSSTRGKFLPR